MKLGKKSTRKPDYEIYVSVDQNMYSDFNILFTFFFIHSFSE